MYQRKNGIQKTHASLKTLNLKKKEKRIDKEIGQKIT